MRLATEEEIKAFNEGIKNVNDIKRKIAFNISYEAFNGETKKVEVEASYEFEAINSIKDLKKINYVMSS